MNYNATVTEHFQHPRNVGELEGANCVGEAENPVCLDRVRIMLLIEDGAVKQARYLAEGCVPTIAAGSVVTTRIVGYSRAELAGITPEMVEDWLGGLPATKKHASHVVIDALRAALAGIT